MRVRIIEIPRSSTCGVRREWGSCVLDITRVVESWDPIRGVWLPQMRLCHCHAEEAVTGKPMLIDHRDRAIDLGA